MEMIQQHYDTKLSTRAARVLEKSNVMRTRAENKRMHVVVHGGVDVDAVTPNLRAVVLDVMRASTARARVYFEIP